MLLRIVFYAPIMGVGGVFKVMSTNASMAWIIGVAVLAIIAIVLVLFVVAMPKFNLMQKLVDKLNLVTREILTGLPVIRAFSTEKYEEERFDKANRNLTRTNLFVNRVMSCMMPVMMLVMNGITLLIVWNGGHGIQNGTMQVGDMMAFIQYTMQIVMAFLMICMMSIMWPRAAVSARRIEEVIQTEAVIRDPEVPASFDEARKGVVEFRDVSFRYPGADENVLTGISFTAKPGETTAFIGSTGSGKSTLINLIPRFYDVSEGSILVSGADVRQVPLHDLRARIGYVPQKGMLFSGTIESNLKYGGDAVANEDMMQAARPRRRISSPGSRIPMAPRSPRGAPTSRAARSSGCPSPAPSLSIPMSIFSTTAFPPSTTRPTWPCAARSGIRPGTARSSSWPSGSAPSCTRTRFSF